jgi:tetratricopeptide repeat protein/PEGA domain-containing protein
VKTAAIPFLLVVLVGPARAEQPEREAKALFREATRLAETGDYAGAADLYRTAYARFPNPKILWNLAQVLERMGRKAEAADVYAEFIRQPGTEEAKRTEGTGLLAELDAQVGKLRIEVPQPGARVVLDGREIGTGTSFTVRVDPGSHSVVAERVGSPPAAATIDVPVGMERAVNLRPGAVVGQAAPAAEKAPPPPPTPVSEPSPVAPATAAAAPAAEPTVVAGVAPESASLDHRGQLGLTLRSETDARTGATGPSAGLSFGATSWLEVAAVALVQKTKGARISASAFLLSSGPWKPFLRLGVPMFSVDGLRPGIDVAGGLLFDVARYAGVVVDVGVEHFPTVPEPFHKTAVVVGLGLQARAF